MDNTQKCQVLKIYYHHFGTENNKKRYYRDCQKKLHTTLYIIYKSIFNIINIGDLHMITIENFTPKILFTLLREYRIFWIDVKSKRYTLREIGQYLFSDLAYNYEERITQADYIWKCIISKDVYSVRQRYRLANKLYKTHNCLLWPSIYAQLSKTQLMTIEALVD